MQFGPRGYKDHDVYHEVYAKCADFVLLAGAKPEASQPQLQVKSGGLEDGSDGDRLLVSAGATNE